MKSKSIRNSSATKKSRKRAHPQPRNFHKTTPTVGIPNATRIVQRKSAWPSSLAGQDPFTETLAESHNVTNAGDLTGIRKTNNSAGEKVIELIDEGQDFEGELVLAVEDGPDPDRAQVPVHRGPRERIPDYKNRNQL